MAYDKNTIKENITRTCHTNFGIPIEDATQAQKYKIIALTVRDQIMQALAVSRGRRKELCAKKVYYLSMEFLIGRLLSNNMLSLMSDEAYAQALSELGIDIEPLYEMESEPGLGNGGLGRLAACFLDSLTALSLPAMGCTIRYEYGLFRQKIVEGEQVELPDNWLADGNMWEIHVPEDECEVHFYGRIEEDWSTGKLTTKHVDYSTVIASPYDIPVIGHGTHHVNRLRTYAAKSPKGIDMALFNQGNYARMMDEKDLAEAISKVLYPEDRHEQGKELRLRQEYFLASATVQFILKDFIKVYGRDLHELPNFVAIQINDTHPTLAICEMMRLHMDEHGFRWDDAGDLCRRTFAYTNHTVLSEALEKWDENIFKKLLPRIYTIVEEMNKRLCAKLWDHFPNQWDRIAQMAILAYGQVHMANLCVAYTSMTNGVSQLHADILKKDTFRDYYMLEPNKFTGITNGITHRRWLMDANPRLTGLISEAIGEKWIYQPELLSELLPFADDAAFVKKYQKVKQDNKKDLAAFLKKTQGVTIDPATLFDVQAKRIHEYKRQLLNILHVLYLYDRLHEDPNFVTVPKTYIFGGKAAPGYVRAKQIIKLILSVAKLIDSDPVTRGKLKVVFLENYNVSSAEILIPAANISEQISTAGKEASGTGNMKFMINGALTCGTLDGANVEILEQAGEENIYIFGLKAEEVSHIYSHGTYAAGEIYANHPQLRRVLDMLINGTLGDTFSDLYHSLLFGSWGAMADPYLVLKDFDSYAATQQKMSEDFKNPKSWYKMAIANTAGAGFFSSDRTIGEYNDKIWHLKPIAF